MEAENKSVSYSDLNLDLLLDALSDFQKWWQEENENDQSKFSQIEEQIQLIEQLREREV